MKAVVILFGLILFLGCSDKNDSKKTSYACFDIDSVQIKVADFTLKCIEAATANQTGENQDAEDWVKECHRVSVQTFGKRIGEDVQVENGYTNLCGDGT